MRGELWTHCKEERGEVCFSRPLSPMLFIAHNCLWMKESSVGGTDESGREKERVGDIPSVTMRRRIEEHKAVFRLSRFTPVRSPGDFNHVPLRNRSG